MNKRISSEQSMGISMEALRDHITKEELKSIKNQKGKELLIKLEGTGKLLFHGTSRGDISELEPRQGTNKGVKDGEPAVCSTDSSELAIFKAITAATKEKESNYKFIFGRDEDTKKIFYRMSESVVNIIEGTKGYVYVMNKNNFKHERRYEWRSLETINPIIVMEVTNKDMPKNIEIIPDPELNI